MDAAGEATDRDLRTSHVAERVESYTMTFPDAGEATDVMGAVKVTTSPAVRDLSAPFAGADEAADREVSGYVAKGLALYDAGGSGVACLLYTSPSPRDS